MLVLATRLNHYSDVHHYTRQIALSSNKATGSTSGIRKRGRPRKIVPPSQPEVEMEEALGMLKQYIAELHSTVISHVPVLTDHLSVDVVLRYTTLEVTIWISLCVKIKKI